MTIYIVHEIETPFTPFPYKTRTMSQLSVKVPQLTFSSSLRTTALDFLAIPLHCLHYLTASRKGNEISSLKVVESKITDVPDLRYDGSVRDIGEGSGHNILLASLINVRYHKRF